MAEDGLLVKFGAETAELEAAAKKASAAIKSSTDSMRLSAEQARQAFSQFGTDLSKIRPDQMAGLAAATEQVAAAQKSAVSAMSSISNAAHSAGAGVGFYARELHALVDEGLSGRFRQLQGTAANTLATLAQANPIAAAAAAGVAAIAGSLAYFTIKANEAESATAAFRIGLNLAGVTDVTTAQINEMRDAISQVPGATNVMAEEAVTDFSKLHNASLPLIQGLSNIIGDFAQATQNTIPQAAKELVKLFDDPLNAANELNRIFPSLTSGQLQAYQAAQRTGSAFKTQAAIFAIASEQIGKTRREAIDLASGMIEAAAASQALASAGSAIDQSMGAETAAIKESTEAFEKRLKVVNDSTAALNSMPAMPDRIIKTGQDIASKDVIPEEKLENAKRKVQELQAAFDKLKDKVIKAGQVPDADAGVLSLGLHLAYAEKALKELAGTSLQDRIADMDRYATLTRQSEIAITKAHMAAEQEALNNSKLTVEERKKINTDYFANVKKLADQETALSVANANTRAAAAAVNSKQMFAAQRDAAAADLKNAVQGTVAFEQAKQRMIQVNRAASDADLAQARETEAGKYELQLKAVESSMANVREEARAKEISYQQELSQLLALQSKKEEIERAHLTFVASTYQDDAKAYAAAQEKLVALTATNAAERATIFRQTDKQIQDEYTKTFEKMGSTVSSSLMQIIEGTSNWHKLMQNVARQLVSDWLNAGVKMVADWAAVQAKQLIMGQTTQAALTATAAAGAGAQTAAQQAVQVPALANDVKTAIGGFTAFLAPILGPAAPAAAAGLAAGIPAFATGTWQLPSDTLAQLHAGEMIVPASATPWAQSLMANAAGGGGGGGSAVTHHHHYNIQSVDSQAVARLFQNNGKALMQGIGKAIGDGHHLGVRKLSGIGS